MTDLHQVVGAVTPSGTPWSDGLTGGVTERRPPAPQRPHVQLGPPPCNRTCNGLRKAFRRT